MHFAVGEIEHGAYINEIECWISKFLTVTENMRVEWAQLYSTNIEFWDHLPNLAIALMKRQYVGQMLPSKVTLC
jgi:hypothetical protein